MIVEVELEAGGSDAFLRGAVMALGEHNRAWYLEHPFAPGPVEADVRYLQDEPADVVRLYDAAAVLRRRKASCGSLAPMMWGWLMARGRRAWLIVREPRRTAAVWHAVVRTRGGIWDPSTLPRVLAAPTQGKAI